MRRVVITGIGIVSCLGNNQNEVYNSLLNSKSGISFADEYKEHNLKSHVHGKPNIKLCLLYTSPSPRDAHESRMPSSA